MIQPRFLQKGDTIGIVSPSGPIPSDSLDFAIETLHSWDLNVVLGEHVFDSYGVFAGTDADRASDLQSMIDDDSISAILCARGGYGAIRVANLIDYSPLFDKPKWLIGFSDITVFHAKLHALDVASIHGVMAKGFPNVTAESLQSLKNVLFGTIQSTQIPTNSRNKLGSCNGQLVGGNLSMLYSLQGVDFNYDYTDKILFIEDLNEYFYHIDRMMQNLKYSGVLSAISGLVVGTMSGMKNGKDAFKGDIEDIVLDAVGDYDYPVVFDFPSGHEDLNHALIMGGEYELVCNEKSSSLTLKENKLLALNTKH